MFCTGPSLVLKRKQNKQERDRGIENDRERDFFEMCIRGVAAAGGKHVLSPPHASDYWSLGQPPEAAVPGPPTTLPVHIVFALQRRAKRSSISEGRSESIIAQHFPKGINEMPVCFFFSSLSFRALPAARCYYYNECFFPDDDLLFVVFNFLTFPFSFGGVFCFSSPPVGT